MTKDAILEEVNESTLEVIMFADQNGEYFDSID